MASIAVFGGAGYVGRAIVGDASRRGHSVTAIGRSPFAAAAAAAAAADLPAGVEYREGNLHDEALLDELAGQADVLVVAIPARELDGKKLIDALPALTRAAEAHGTRLGVVGGAGSLQVHEGGPRVVDGADFPEQFKPEALGQANVLAALRASSDDLFWFYVSPAAEFGSYAPGEATGSYRTGGDVLVVDDNGHSTISGADFALAFVDEIEQPRHRRERFTVAY